MTSVAVLDPPAPPKAVLVPAGISAPPKVSLESCFELERTSEIRHEYVEGKLIPIPGTTLVHN